MDYRTNKKSLLIGGHIPKNYISITYFSWWIENLGVVPLFLLAVFLFFPILLSRFDLLFFVTRVFDTILMLLYIQIYFCFLIFKENFVRRIKQTVKAFFILYLILSSYSFAKNITHRNHVAHREKSLSLLSGEVEIIHSKKLNKFHVGDKSIVSYRYDKKNNNLLIKGKSTGHTQVLVWEKGNLNPRKISVFVMAKKNGLHLAKLQSEIEKLNLLVTNYPRYLDATGIITEIKHYNRFRYLVKTYPTKINNDVTLSKNLKNFIISKIYKQFFIQYVDFVNCENQNIQFICHYPEDQTLPSAMISNLKETMDIIFIPTVRESTQKVYKVKLKLIQIEKLDGEELNWGLDKIQTKWSSVINNGVSSLVNSNNIFLNNNDIHVSTLAEPTALITTTSPLNLQVGSDIPFTTKADTPYSSNTTWKFAGLKIKINLKESKGKWILDYQTEFTRPEAQGKAISGNKEKGRTYIKLGKTSSLFQIGFKTEGKSTSRLPWISKIPILGALFKSKSKQSTHKNITGLILITKEEG